MANQTDLRRFITSERPERSIQWNTNTTNNRNNWNVSLHRHIQTDSKDLPTSYHTGSRARSFSEGKAAAASS